MVNLKNIFKESNNKITNSNIDEKQKKIIIILLTILLILLIIIIFSIKNERVLWFSNKQERNFKKEYEILNNQKDEQNYDYIEVNIPKKNKIRYTTSEEILNFLNNKKDVVVYFGSAECMYCRIASETLINTASKTKLKKIYYLDTSKVKKDDSYTKLLNKLGEYYLTEQAGEKVINSPVVIFIVNGKIVSSNIGTLSTQRSPFDELDESQLAGLTEIYLNGINDVINAKKS